MSPTTMPAITHVAVTVSDLEASEAWYTKVLGNTVESGAPFDRAIAPRQLLPPCRSWKFRQGGFWLSGRERCRNSLRPRL